MRAVIISHQPSVRETLHNALKQVGNYMTIIAEADNFKQAQNLLSASKPDLAFVDADLPGSEAFTLMQALQSAGIAFVVLSDTEQHAFRAVELGALGYLLAPVAAEKVAVTVQRMKKLLGNELNGSVQGPPPGATHSDHWKDWLERRFYFCAQKCISIIALKDIIQINAARYETEIYVVGMSKPVTCSIGISDFLKEFEEVPFIVKTHRSHLVNLFHVKRYVKDDGVLIVRDHNGGEGCVSLADAYKESLIQAMQNLGWKRISKT